MNLNFPYRGLVVLVICKLALALSLAPLRSPATAQSTDNSSQSTTAPDRSLVVTDAGLAYKSIRFGEKLVVLVTLHNQGPSPIIIPPGSLRLTNEKWMIEGSGSGTGRASSPLSAQGVYEIEGVTLQPGESVVLSASHAGLGAHSIGRMQAEFVIETEAPGLHLALGKPAPIVVSYYVAPSELMTSAWAARTSEERERLRSQISKLLQLSSRPGASPAFYVSKTLDHLGCDALLFLESAISKDSDAVVREQAVRALWRAPMAAENLNRLRPLESASFRAACLLSF
jgi:hypothetical protein